MRRLPELLLLFSFTCAACGSSTGGGGGVVADDAVCADASCADASADGAVDAADTTGAMDVWLNDVAGSEVTADVHDAGDVAAADVTEGTDVAVADVPVVPDVPDSVQDVPPDATSPDVDAGTDLVPTDDALDVADIPDVPDAAAPDVAAEDTLANDVAAVDAPDALVDPWAACPAGALTTLFEGAAWVQDLRVYNNTVYWSAYGPADAKQSGVYAMPATGVPVPETASPIIAGSDTATYAFQGLDVNANGVYVAVDGPSAILTAPLSSDGSQPATQLVGQENNVLMTVMQPRQLTVFDGTIYFRDDEYSPFTFPPGIRQVSTAGGLVTVVPYTPKSAGYPHINSAGLAYNAAADAANGVTGGIYFLPAGASTPQLMSAGTQSIGPDIDATTVYWSQVGDGTDGVWKALMAGGPATQLAAMPGANVLVQDDASGNVYFYASKVVGPYLKAAIFKVAKTGGAITPVVCDIPGAVWNIRSDANKVYFSYATGKAMSWGLAPNAIGSADK